MKPSKPTNHIWRDKNGIPHVEADTMEEMYWGQGYIHALDRGMQMVFMRVLGQGRAAELLDASDETVQIDMFFRRMNWSGHTQEPLAALSAQHKQYLQAYSDGVNAGFAKKTAWEFKLLGYKPEAWQPEDSILMSRMVGYLTLAQSQAEMERLLVELVQAGIGEAKLEALFPGILGGLDIDLLQKVTLHERIVPSNVLWNTAVPRMMASNNWVISGQKTASGKPIVANDPHLEVNRLPNVWSEIVLTCNGRYFMGGAMPGFPGILTGRTPDMAWGVTYSFIDAVDSWIERCENGRYFREEGEQWQPFHARQETIKRKKKEAIEVTFYENEHGVLDGDPNENGYYLATRWAAAESGHATLAAIFDMWDLKTAVDGMDNIGKVETGWDFVLADMEGNIGFQMSGHVPRRREGVGGFVPLPGWQAQNDWQGLYSHEDMPRILNPEQGHFATANQDLNRYGRINPINMPMGAYRANRINQLLAEGGDFTTADVYTMHFDVYSLQAELFMPILKPLLPDTAQGRLLRDWDLRYDPDSQGAYLFEQIYKGLYRAVFGENGFGDAAATYLADETGTYIDFYENFDRVLLAKESVWFGEQSRDEIYRRVVADALATEPKRWRDVQEFTMVHLLLGGKLPRFMGFDRGPLVGIGGRATIHQGQIYRSANRDTTFMPSYRLVMDMAQPELFTNLAGGPSDRRFSKWYCSDLDNWVNGRYKRIVAGDEEGKIPFP